MRNTPIVLAAAALVLLGACERRGRTRNSSASALFEEEHAAGSTNVYRYVDLEHSLADSRRAVREERWGDALASSRALLERQPGHAEAEALFAEARLEAQMKVHFDDFGRQVEAGQVEAAVRQYLSIDEASLYRERGRATFEKLRGIYVDHRIAVARALVRDGRCDDARRAASATAALFPDAQAALEEAAAHCRPRRGADLGGSPFAPEPTLDLAEAVALMKSSAAAPPPPPPPPPPTPEVVAETAPAPPAPAEESERERPAAPLASPEARTLAAAMPDAALTRSAPAHTASRAPAQQRPPALSPAERSKLLVAYLQGQVHPQIKRHFSYPQEARRQDEEGAVVVRLSIDGRGGLLGASVAGSCPAASLCEAALATAYEAAPYPAPPPLLGSKVDLLVRMQYVLER